MKRKDSGIDRRDFLKTASGVGAALASSSISARPAATEVSDITDLSASRLSDAIRNRKVSCVEVMQAYLDRIERLNHHYTAIISMKNRDELIGEARIADTDLDAGRYRGWMHGMPHAVKDLTDAIGLPTTEGSPIYADRIADSESLAIARIRDAGAIFIAKTNTPEFGYGSQSYNPVSGTTKSAYDITRTAGGSSGGSACGLATHMLPVADGSDMMGSLRNPGAFNNVVGFRPSACRIPDYPKADVYYQRLSTKGPMGRTVEDTIRLLETMAGYDPRDPLSLRDSVPPFEKYRPASLRDYRIGWMGDYGGYLAMEHGVIDICESALRGIETTGARVDPCLPEYDQHRLWRTWLTLRHWSALWMRELYDDTSTRDQLKPELIFEFEGGLNVTQEQLFYAGAARTDWYQALLALFDDYDILALPTAQVFPFDADVHWPRSVGGRDMDTYHRWMEVVIGGTLAGLPVVNLPAGFNDQGLPMGMQFIGRMGQDRQVLEFALAWEQATDFLDIRPPAPQA